MGIWTVSVFSVDVAHNVDENNRRYEVGDPTTVTVQAKRQERGTGNAYNRKITYRVEDGIAEVKAIEPTYPKSDSTDPAFRPAHVAAILAETDPLVKKSVEGVEAVKALGHTLTDNRPKPDGDAEQVDE